MLARLLHVGGYTTVESRSGEDAWSLLEGGIWPIWVLLDLRMPGMGGLGFLLRLRADQRFQALPVTVITADMMLDSPSNAALRALGATLMFKPVHTADVLALAARMTTPHFRLGPPRTLRRARLRRR